MTTPGHQVGPCLPGKVPLHNMRVLPTSGSPSGPLPDEVLLGLPQKRVGMSSSRRSRSRSSSSSSSSSSSNSSIPKGSLLPFLFSQSPIQITRASRFSPHALI